MMETTDFATLHGLKLGFLGFGKMGQAIARGLRARLPAAELQLSACDVVRPEQSLLDECGVEFVPTAPGLESAVDVLILAVKPQDMARALEVLAGDRRYISIAAGVSTASLNQWLRANPESRQKSQISRVMPNISALCGQGVSGIYCEDDEFFSLSAAIFSAVGQVVRVKSEDWMHAVTGLSGSGPAFVLAVIQALAEGGVLAGLPYDTALQLARETVLGTAHLLRESNLHPAQLRNQVTSPGGTTIAGLQELESGGVPGTLMRAVAAAAERSRELAGE